MLARVSFLLSRRSPWRLFALVALCAAALILLYVWTMREPRKVRPPKDASLRELLAEHSDVKLDAVWGAASGHEAPALSGDHTGLLTVRRFAVDLDKPPTERWAHVIPAFRSQLLAASQYMDELLSQAGLQAQGSLPEVKERLFKLLRPQLAAQAPLSGQQLARLKSRPLPLRVHDEAEVAAVAELSGLPLSSVALLQMVFELSALCTSVVASLRDGSLAHGRTLDWDADFLRRLTIEVDFRRGNRTVFLAATWAGYLGVLTGVRPQRFSVSVNYRRGGDESLADVFSGFQAGGWSVGHLVRDILDNVPVYGDALRRFESEPLLQPAYIIVASASGRQARVVTRTRKSAVRTYGLLAPGLSPNDPEWRAIEEEDEMRGTGETARAARDEMRGGAGAAAPVDRLDDDSVWSPSLVQGNSDHWLVDADESDTMNSGARVRFARRFLDHRERNHRLRDEREMWTLLASEPVHSDATVYVAVMNAQHSTIETRV